MSDCSDDGAWSGSEWYGTNSTNSQFVEQVEDKVEPEKVEDEVGVGLVNLSENLKSFAEDVRETINKMYDDTIAKYSGKSKEWWSEFGSDIKWDEEVARRKIENESDSWFRRITIGEHRKFLYEQEITRDVDKEITDSVEKLRRFVYSIERRREFKKPENKKKIEDIEKRFMKAINEIIRADKNWDRLNEEYEKNEQRMKMLLIGRKMVKGERLVEVEEEYKEKRKLRKAYLARLKDYQNTRSNNISYLRNLEYFVGEESDYNDWAEYGSFNSNSTNFTFDGYESESD